MSAPSVWQLAKNSVFLWVGMVFVPIGALFFIITIHLGMEEYAFAKYGQTVAATVVGKSLQKADFDKNPATRYLVRYRFAFRTDAQVEQTMEIPIEEWEHLAPGGMLNIRTVPGSRIESRDSRHSNRSAIMALATLGLIFVAVGTPLMLRGIREIRRQRRLWHTGRTVPAVVTAVAPTSTRINGVRQWEIRYAYSDANGARHKGRSNPMPEQDARQWQNGDHATARFDPDAADSSIWLGKSQLD